MRKTHIDDSLRLQFVNLETCLEITLGIGRSTAIADDVNHLVDVVASDDQTFEDMCLLLSLCQVELGTTDDHLMTMGNEVLDELLQVEEFWHTKSLWMTRNGDKSNIIDREVGLQFGHLIELVEDDIGVDILLEVDDDAHALTVGLVVDIGYAFDLLFVGKLGNMLDEFCLIDAVRNLGDDNAVVLAFALDFGLAADHDFAATGLIGLSNTIVTKDDAARWEVGSLDVLHQFVNSNLRIVDIGTDAIDTLREIVGRHIGGHADSDAIGAIYKKGRDTSGEHLGLHECAVEVGHHIDGILVDIAKHLLGNLRETCLGITHSSGAIAVD